MPDFLTDAWIAALAEKLASATALRAVAPLVIEQVVTGVPGRGEVRYQLQVDADSARIVTSDLASATVRVTTDYGTARAIARGEENAQAALAAGRLRLGGSVEQLARSASVLSALDDVTAELRGATCYPEP